MRVPMAVLWLIMATATYSASAKEPAQSSNAAVHYWCAAAVMRRPENAREQKTLDYIEDWSLLPPEVFIERRDAVDFLRADLVRGGTMDMLHLGAECPLCDFDTDRQTAEGWLPHDELFRILARRGWAEVCALEGQGEFLRAAQLHADLLQFSAHLCQSPELGTSLVGAAVMSASLGQMEAFLALKPGPEALRALMDRLNRIRPNPMSFSRCWSYSAKFRPMLLTKELRLTDEDLDQALRWDDKRKDLKPPLLFFLMPEWKTTLQFVRSKTPEERRALVEGWAKQVGEELNAVAKAGEGPPAEAEPRIQAEVERMKQLAKPADSGAGNPFLASQAGLPVNVYAHFARINATLEMGRIICAAALFKAENGRYPTSLDALAKYFPAGLPKDPFTAKEFLYALEEGLPCVTAQPSTSLRGELKNWDCRMSLADTLKRQGECLERYRKKAQNPPSANQ